jgi:hypothetical protein
VLLLVRINFLNPSHAVFMPDAAGVTVDGRDRTEPFRGLDEFIRTKDTKINTSFGKACAY